MHFCRFIPVEYQGWLTEILAVLVNNCAQGTSPVTHLANGVVIIICGLLILTFLSREYFTSFMGPDIKKELTYFVYI